jgi:hypothetical protein
MITSLYTRAFVYTFIAPAIAVVSAVTPPRMEALQPAEAAALRASSDSSLESLRAGNVDAPAPLSAAERADLAAAQQNSPALAEMRGGAVMTDHELTWLAVGALIVILVLVI